MGEHIAHAELSLFAHDKLAVERERRQEIESHVANCAECGATLDFYSVAEDDLRDLAVWRPIAGSTAAAMSAYANQCAAEDAEADELLQEFFTKPRKAAVLNVRNVRKFHTGGVVRRLNAQAHEVVASEPLDALIFADLAQTVAELLPMTRTRTTRCTSCVEQRRRSVRMRCCGWRNSMTRWKRWNAPSVRTNI